MLSSVRKFVSIGCILMAVTSRAATETFEFEAASSSESVAPVKSVPARSDIECSILCTRTEDFSCQTGEFQSDTQTCQLHAVKRSGFVKAWKPDVTVTRDSRTFRVIQQRLHGNISFNRNWAEYENGFGERTGDFWIGLKAIHDLTRTGRQLRVEVTRFSGVVFVCEYSGFTVGDASTQYTMDYASYINENMTGVPDYGLGHNKGSKFSTADKYESTIARDCAVGGGGWWHSNGCTNANTNGKYSSTEAFLSEFGFIWFDAGSTHNTLKESRLMLEV